MEPSMTKNSSSSRAPAALSSKKPPQTAKKRASRAERNCKQKHRLCTLLHSNRLEKDRFRIRVHRNIKNDGIRPKPLRDHVSTVKPSSARVPKPIRRTPQATPIHQKTQRYEGEGRVQISHCEQRDEEAAPGTVSTNGCSSHCVRG